MTEVLKSIPRRALMTAAAGLAALASPALAQPAWPNRTVRVIVPWPPGGAADLVARLYTNAMTQRTGQPFVVENRGGATGTIGEAATMQSPADGYTIMNQSTPMSVTPALFPGQRYSPAQEFIPVFQTMSVPQLVLVNNDSPARTPAELIALMREANGDFPAGSSGIGSLQHLALELFCRAAGVRANHIPYRGGAPATTDLIGGQIKLYLGNVNSTATYVRDGALRALAHTAATPRINALPDLPPLSDTLPGFTTAEWNGVFVRTGTPAPIVAQLSALLNEVVVDPAVVEALRAGDLTAGPNTPEQFAAFFTAESTRWQQFVREANIRLE
ncbi:MAG: tripartite tricarboxylate transporter family receptor [Rubritepida sp.]|nr:tripartite tricarboxylate transporter family receptor [Rubritepida sp.]